MSPTCQEAPARPREVAGVFPGLLAAATIALAASWLAQHYGGPVMVFALLLGVAFNFLSEHERCVAGIELASRTVLRLGVTLLGARIAAGQILGLGLAPILMVVAGVVTTMGLGLLLARRLGLGWPFGLLSGGAVAICGASAAMAIASVLPKDRRSQADTAFTIILATALSTLAMLLYPPLAAALGLSDSQAGVFLGGAIHDVAQVIGAGYVVSQGAGDTATYVKLLRVAMLLPVVLGLGLALGRRRGAADEALRQGPPWFLIGFAGLVALNSVVDVPAAWRQAAGETSRWCFIAAIAALGMKTSFAELVSAGWRPAALVVVETVWIAALALACVRLFV